MATARPFRVCVAAALAAMAPGPAAADEAIHQEARDAMARATAYFTSIATGGGWAGIYSLDLKERWGESLHEKARPTEIWVQPPGTPTVGRTLLRAYRATGERRYLDAARHVGRALVWGQRTVGGWDHRVDVAHLTADAAAPQRRDGRCTFDDRITQGAVEFLMDLDRTLDEPWLDDGVALGLGFLLKSQFPNGAWPQWFPLRGGYHDCYTFNDATINDCIRTLLEAHRQYGKEEYLAGAKRGADFILLAQLPRPQAGWAQQYGHDLKPAWARAFEPPGVCSAVTARNIRTLADVAVYTGDAKYLEAVPAALEWLERSKLKENLWARLYEVGTNRPIYGDRDGKVHYTLAEISEERRTGYSWQSDYGVRAAAAYYEKVRATGPSAYRAERERAEATRAAAAQRPRSGGGKGYEPRVRQVIDALDEQGRWVDKDQRLRCATFVRNLGLLCDYVEAVAGAGGGAAPAGGPARP